MSVSEIADQQYAACVKRGTPLIGAENGLSTTDIETNCRNRTQWWGGKNKRIRSVKSRKNKRKSSKRTQSKKKGGRSKSKKSN